MRDHPTYTNPELRHLGLELRPYVADILRTLDFEEADLLLDADQQSRDGHILNLLERDALAEMVEAAEEVAEDTGLFGVALRRELERREAEHAIAL